MKIAIRMDDITPGMDMAKFLRFKELCDLYQVKPLLGIVPDNKDSMLEIDEHREDFWDYLLTLQKEGWVLAQHGVDHVYKTRKKGCFPLNALSEFAGLGYDRQYEALKRGKEILEAHGIKTDIFMAPAHSYDRNTLKALHELGFQRITDGFGKQPYIWKQLTFFPISFKQSSSLKTEKGYTTFVVHANTMNDRDFERYEKLLEENKDSFISYSEYLTCEATVRSEIGHVIEYLRAMSKYILVRIKNMLQQ